ncbi:hypothetical protein QFZ75_007972 [Streptomyces sp. V3I8]|uniref:DUF2637 domain-containing protein n=1 Tax=Streptomyces sp. V3I8 TaxID=3042279 RepID=UPI00278867D5|nr:DUF2637 domain-containing protein [Streptomyces sp. V3I8]MDQ1041470.1 hypothetical protein [Streptomyces sp. V3I8]
MTLTKRTRNDPPKSAIRPWRDRLAHADLAEIFDDGLIYLLAAGGFWLGFSTLYDLALQVDYSAPQAAGAAALADVAILAYSRKALREIRAGRSAWGLRLIVALFSIATFALQLRAAWPDPTSLAFHCMPPAVWIIGHEAMLRGKIRDARKALREQQIAAGLRPAPLPTIRISHWFLSPLPTFRVWRRMKLWELPQHVVVRQLVEDRKAKGNKAIPAAWQGILLTPVPLSSDDEPLELEDGPVAIDPPSEDTDIDMWRRFLRALPDAPPEGRSKETALAYIECVERLAGEFGFEVRGTLLAHLLSVDPSRISRIRNQGKELATTGS